MKQRALWLPKGTLIKLHRTTAFKTEKRPGIRPKKGSRFNKARTFFVIAKFFLFRPKNTDFDVSGQQRFLRADAFPRKNQKPPKDRFEKFTERRSGGFIKRFAYFGDKTIVICLPSNLAACSTFA